ncbi:hypothetical protein QTN53_06560 [Levilactobacillus brevis]|nr:hypothetical protein [Levilactobacillus brevis]DAP36990.1 MAG TPA: hypothetical protein [Caudoviricetes sp.]
MTECPSVIVTGVGLPEEGGLNLNPCAVRFHTNRIERRNCGDVGLD